MLKTSIKLAIFFVLLMLQSIVYADEIYKDKDGVWRNRETTGESVGRMSTTIGEAYSNFWIKGPPADYFKGVMQRHDRATKKSLDRIMYDHQQKIAEIERKEAARKMEEEAKKRVSDAESYEKFDPSKAVEVKSEWEYFDDPR